MRERLKSAPAEEIVAYMIAPRLFDEAKTIFPIMSRINQAHTVMLVEQDILPADVGGRILGGLAKLAEAGVEALALDPGKEDLYFNVEAALSAAIGADIGGRMHTGRSRNDLYATVQRMKVRDVACDMAGRALVLQGRLLDAAAGNLDTVMTGYTHMQPGQPITVGHYLSGVAQALQRDSWRILDAYRSLNLSPLGAGGLATTGFPIDRFRTAALLGFDGIVENSLDAVGSRDYVSDLIYAFATAAITVSRLCHDLHVWYTFEFGFLDIDDAIAGTSSIMPQKKNPSPIEHLKAKAAHQIGALVSSLSAQKTAPFTHGREVGNESVALFKEAAAQMEATLALADAVVRGLRFRAETLLDDARRNYCTLTELADTMVRHRGLSFRTAHEVVGALAREAADRRLAGSHAITAELVDEVAVQVTGKPLALTAAELKAALDPAFNVQQRRVPGGPAPAAVAAAVERLRGGLAEQRALLDRRLAALAAADAELAAAAARLAA
ncbi:argininosuccinate lyase [Stella sp.]|uniref:argininosuccinate lyase n=1 Tax=Stella sp. TaxID=2912054 RepID=UPI0035ADDA99